MRLLWSKTITELTKLLVTILTFKSSKHNIFQTSFHASKLSLQWTFAGTLRHLRSGTPSKHLPDRRSAYFSFTWTAFWRVPAPLHHWKYMEKSTWFLILFAEKVSEVQAFSRFVDEVIINVSDCLIRWSVGILTDAGPFCPKTLQTSAKVSNRCRTVLRHFEPIAQTDIILVLTCKKNVIESGTVKPNSNIGDNKYYNIVTTVSLWHKVYSDAKDWRIIVCAANLYVVKPLVFTLINDVDKLWLVCIVETVVALLFHSVPL